MFDWCKCNRAELEKLFQSDLELGLDRQGVKQNRALFGSVSRKTDEKQARRRQGESRREKEEILNLAVFFFAAFLCYLFTKQQAYLCVLGVVLCSTALYAVVAAACSALIKRNIGIAGKGKEQPRVAVIRDGRQMSISATALVAGDVVILLPGSILPCTVRLIYTDELYVTQKGETGYRKKNALFNPDRHEAVMPGQMDNMVWAGSVVLAGFGRGMAVDETLDSRTANERLGYLGKKERFIPDLTYGVYPGDEAGAEPSLSDRVHSLARIIRLGMLGAGFATILILLFLSVPVADSLLAGLFLVFSALPAFFDLCIRFSTAMALFRLKQHRITVTSPDVLERMAQLDTILFKEETAIAPTSLTLTSVYTNGREYEIEEIYTERIGILMKYAGLMTDIETINKDDRLEYLGSLEDLAVIKALFSLSLCDRKLAVIRQYDKKFYSSTGRVTGVSITENKEPLGLIKGDAEFVLTLCTRYETNTLIESLDELSRERIYQAAVTAKARGDRVTGVAYRSQSEDLENGYIFLGFLFFQKKADLGAVNVCNNRLRDAGVSPKLLCDLQEEAACRLALAAGWIQPQNADGTAEGHAHSSVLTRESLGSMDEDLSYAVLPSYEVYCRLDLAGKELLLSACNQKGMNTGLMVSQISELAVFPHAQVTFAQAEEVEAVKRGCDVYCEREGAHALVDAIEQARTFFKNVGNGCITLLAMQFSFVVALFLSLLSTIASPAASGASEASLFFPLVAQAFYLFFFAIGASLTMGLSGKSKDRMVLTPYELKSRYTNTNICLRALGYGSFAGISSHLARLALAGLGRDATTVTAGAYLCLILCMSAALFGLSETRPVLYHGAAPSFGPVVFCALSIVLLILSLQTTHGREFLSLGRLDLVCIAVSVFFAVMTFFVGEGIKHWQAHRSKGRMTKR